MKKQKTFMSLVALIVFLAATTWGQTPTPASQGCFFGAEGYVTETLGKPISGATIHADTAGTTTDKNGYYSISHIQLNCNALYVSASANGYAMISKSTGSTPGTYTINFTLIPYISDLPFTSIPGDVNKDKAVNIIDALLVAQYITGINVTTFDTLAADVNGNKVIDITDALLISQYSAGLVPNLIYIWPQSGSVGTTVTVWGIQLESAANDVHFIDPKMSSVYFNSYNTGSADGRRLTLNIPVAVNPYCYYQQLPCAAPSLNVTAGSYLVSVTTSKGESFAVPFTVQ